MEEENNEVNKQITAPSVADNCTLSSIEKIDFVLKYLALPENKGVYRSIDEIRIGEVKYYNRVNFYDSITREDLVIIIMKLMKEKHVVEFNTLMGNSLDELRFATNLFKISFDGLLWLERGGYQGEVGRQSVSVGRQATEDQRNKYLLLITFAIGVGTVVAGAYYLVSIFDFYEKHSLDQQRCVYFVSGFAIALLIWLSTALILKMKNKTKTRQT